MKLLKLLTKMIKKYLELIQMRKLIMNDFTQKENLVIESPVKHNMPKKEQKLKQSTLSRKIVSCYFKGLNYA